MPCLNPRIAWIKAGKSKNGKKLITFSPSGLPTVNFDGDLKLPCGHCLGCIEDKKKKWIKRLSFENLLHKKSTFLTLTYADAPDNLSKVDVQKFLKRFRNSPRDYSIPLDSFKYFAIGERGSLYGRPHYHLILFGVDFFTEFWHPYLALVKPDGTPIYSSKIIEKIWNKGFVSIGECNSNSITYIVKYMFKSYSNNDETFYLCSPKIGANLFYNFTKIKNEETNRYRHIPSLKQSSIDLYLNNKVVLPTSNGKFLEYAIPNNFDIYLEKSDINLYDIVKTSRMANIKPFNAFASAEAIKHKNKINKAERPLHYGKH